MSTDLEPVETDNAAPALTSKYKRLSVSDIRTILDLHTRGNTQAEIASVIGCSRTNITRILQSFSDDAKTVALQMRALTAETITDWRRARKVAAKRGDHRPSREWLEAAYPELRPQPAAQNNAGVTVIVAVPGGDNRLPSISSSATDATPLALSPSVSLLKP